MIVAEELIEEYKERYEVNRLEAIRMVLEDLRAAEKELEKLGAEEMLERGVFGKGFTGIWSDFRLSPADCMEKVVEGKLKVVGEDKFHRKVYEVVEEFKVKGGEAGGGQ